MLTSLVVENLEKFDHAEIELGKAVVFIGPNNSGKTSALQAMTLWEIGLRKWLEKRTGSEERSRHDPRCCEKGSCAMRVLILGWTRRPAMGWQRISGRRVLKSCVFAARDVVMASVLDEELKTYAAHREELLGTARGMFDLIKGGQVLCVFASREDALKRGYEEYGNQP